jgi:hypothetical protein
MNELRATTAREVELRVRGKKRTAEDQERSRTAARRSRRAWDSEAATATRTLNE